MNPSITKLAAPQRMRCEGRISSVKAYCTLRYTVAAYMETSDVIAGIRVSTDMVESTSPRRMLALRSIPSPQEPVIPEHDERQKRQRECGERQRQRRRSLAAIEQWNHSTSRILLRNISSPC
jgi:hypothetical protein